MPFFYLKESQMKQLTFLSADQETGIHMVYWLPETSPIATIQLVHGMAEYSERYGEFAEYFTKRGYAVIGHDHLGHGWSVDKLSPQYGYFTSHNSSKVVIDDIEQVTSWIERHFESIPHIILGHSMGSFAIRSYLQMPNNFQKNQGIILMGTGKKPRFLGFARFISTVLNQLAPTKTNNLLDKIVFGNYAKSFTEDSLYNWLSKNQKNVRAYEQDNLMGFTFTNNGFYTLFKLIANATQKNWAKRVNPDADYLIISGANDPVGDYSEGPKKVADELSTAGVHSIELKLFEDLRHELLFEKEKQEVYKMIDSWTQKNILQK